jgi:hypothetical protein
MKMRITIDVEREGESLTDSDLIRAVSACAHVIDADDAGAEPYVGHGLHGGLTCGYRVDEVAP